MKNWSAIRAYFGVVSVLSMVGMVISAGTLLYALGNKLFISDEEFLAGGNRSYELTQCDQPEYKIDKPIERTAENKAACKVDAASRLVAARSYDQKSDGILGLVWLIITSVVYGYHFPKLKSLKAEFENDK